MECPACGAQTPESARFCASCGHRLESRDDERRVVSVVFGDIVGFTTLSEQLDPEQVKNLVDDVFDALREVIVGFGGRVDKVVGDGIVALFGAPVAHEDDAERAVRAALKMQEAVQVHDERTGSEIRMRIGVNTGEVLVGGFRADDDYTAMGDVVNTASRLQEHAQPGSVVVGPATYRATSDVVRYRALGALAARGRGEPVDAWRAIEAIGLPGHHRIRSETPLIGRELEVQALCGAVEAAFDRDRSTLVLISGDAGVGKTRLCEEIVERATARRRVTVVAGRSVPYGEANVWWPFADALQSSMGLDDLSTTEQTRSAVAAAVSSSFRKPPDHPSVGRATNGLLYLLGHPGPLDGIDPQRAMEEAGRGLRTYLQGVAEQGPLVLWLDDLHWADQVVLAMVDALLVRANRLPFVVLAAARYDLFERWSPRSGRHNVVSIGLDPLDDTDAIALVGSLASGLDPALQRELVDRSGGNPFVIEELVALLGDGSVRAVDASALPNTVRGLVSARLDHLTSDENRVLEDAAVLGRSGTVVGLELTAEAMRGSRDIGAALRGLAEKDLLEVDGGRWSFRSEVTREVAYERLTKSDRARRHAGVALHLEDRVGPRAIAQIADHYRRAAELSLQLGGVSGIPDDIVDRAVDSIRQAVDRATVDEAHGVSVALVEQALGLVADDDPRRVSLLLDRARIGIDRRDREAAARDLGEVVALLGDDLPAESARADLLRGELESWSPDPRGALDHLRRAADAYHDLGDEAGVAQARRQEGLTHLFLGDHDAADACFAEALERFRAAGDARGAAWAVQNLAWVSYSRGRAEEAETRIERSMELFEQLGDQGGLSWGRGLLAYLRMHQGRFDEAEELARVMLVDARERGDRWGEGMMVVLQASVRLWTGRPVEAAALAADAVAVFERLADPLGVTQARAVLGRALVRSGRVDEGLAVLADATGRGDAAVQAVGSMGSVAAAAALVGLGEPAAALAVLGPRRAGDPALIGEVDRQVARGLALLQLGRLAEAVEVLDAITEIETPAGNALAARALAASVAGDRAATVRLADLVDATPAATYLDRAQAAVARALVAAADGDLGAALDALDRADAEVPAEDRVATLALARARLGVLVARGRSVEARAATAAHIDELVDEIGRDALGWGDLFGAALAAGGQAGALV